MNILFSGLNGYLGHNISNHLLKNNIFSVLNREYCIGDSKKDFDCFFYFSNPNEIDFNTNSEKAMIDMVKHFYAVLRVLDSLEVKHIVYASTVRVYDRNVNNYANTHLFVENLLTQYTYTKGIALTITRFGNIFGGSIDSMIKRSSLVPHIFIKKALEEKKIQMLSDGFQYRDFTPTFVVNRYIDFILEEKPEKIDICTGVNIQIIDVINIISKEFPDVEIKASNKSLNESIVEYTSMFNIKKEEIEQEIRKNIKMWKSYYDSNIK